MLIAIAATSQRLATAR